VNLIIKMNWAKKAHLRGAKKVFGVKGKTVLSSKDSLWNCLQNLVAPGVVVL